MDKSELTQIKRHPGEATEGRQTGSTINLQLPRLKEPGSKVQSGEWRKAWRGSCVRMGFPSSRRRKPMPPVNDRPKECGASERTCINSRWHLKRTIRTLNSALALLHLFGVAAGVFQSLMDGRVFALEEIIIAPVTFFWVLSALLFAPSPVAWAGSTAGGLMVLYNGLLMLGLVWIHIHFDHLDPSDGTLFAIVFGGLSVLAALFLISGLITFRKDWGGR
jgi:hypothetical protein